MQTLSSRHATHNHAQTHPCDMLHTHMGQTAHAGTFGTQTRLLHALPGPHSSTISSVHLQKLRHMKTSTKHDPCMLLPVSVRQHTSGQTRQLTCLLLPPKRPNQEHEELRGWGRSNLAWLRLRTSPLNPKRMLLPLSARASGHTCKQHSNRSAHTGE
jgi:hypothetical protein